MANPDPCIKQLVPTQYQRLGDEPLGKVIGCRYPARIEAFLLAMGPPERSQFIRDAVERAANETHH